MIRWFYEPNDSWSKHRLKPSKCKMQNVCRRGLLLVKTDVAQSNGATDLDIGRAVHGGFQALLVERRKERRRDDQPTGVVATAWSETFSNNLAGCSTISPRSLIGDMYRQSPLVGDLDTTIQKDEAPLAHGLWRPQLEMEMEICAGRCAPPVDPPPCTRFRGGAGGG